MLGSMPSPPRLPTRNNCTLRLLNIAPLARRKIPFQPNPPLTRQAHFPNPSRYGQSRQREMGLAQASIQRYQGPRQVAVFDSGCGIVHRVCPLGPTRSVVASLGFVCCVSGSVLCFRVLALSQIQSPFSGSDSITKGTATKHLHHITRINRPNHFNGQGTRNTRAARRRRPESPDRTQSSPSGQRLPELGLGSCHLA
jgi:hypothetical protein